LESTSVDMIQIYNFSLNFGKYSPCGWNQNSTAEADKHACAWF